MINNQIRNFRKTLRQFERQLGFQKEKCIIGNTLSKCHTLLEIEELKEATTGRIARNLGLEKSNLSRTINSLVKQGLVKRETNTKDRRYILLTLTEKGVSACETINSNSDEFFQRVFSKIPVEHRHKVCANLILLVQAIESVNYVRLDINKDIIAGAFK
jgi:DNA-binding MarR family transcriptional regulator